MRRRLGPWFGPPMKWAEHWECTNEEYHASPGTSNSMVSNFVDDPELFEGFYVSKLFERPKQTTAQKFGTLIHDLVLDPNGVGSKLMLIPTELLNMNGAAGGKAFKLFQGDNPGKVFVKMESPEHLICENVKRNAKAMAIIEQAVAFEYSLRCTDPETGLLMRCRLDLWSAQATLDVKTTFNTSKAVFEREIEKKGYHRQAAIYQDVFHEMYGERLPFSFLPIRTKPPYRVEVYTMSEAFMEKGRKEVNEVKIRLARCFEEQVWNTANDGQILELDPPGYRGHGETQSAIKLGTFDDEPDDDEFADEIEHDEFQSADA